jgi:hypothetical protein
MPSFKTAFGSYLKGEDLQGREVRVVIAKVALEAVKSDSGTEQKLVAHFVGKDKAMVLNRTNAEAIAAIAGTDDYEQWGGAMCVLYFDPTVKMGSKTTGGIRIRGARAAAQQRPAPAPPPPPPADEGDDTPITADDIPF